MDILRGLVTVILVFIMAPVQAQTGLGIGDDEAAEWGAERQPGEEPSIPMNMEDPTWDAWKMRRDDLQEGRVPGVFNFN